MAQEKAGSHNPKIAIVNSTEFTCILFLFLNRPDLFGLSLGQDSSPYCPPSSHCHLLLALTQMSRPLMQYISTFLLLFFLAKSCTNIYPIESL